MDERRRRRDSQTTPDRLRRQSRRPGALCIVGLGNIGSRIALEAPLIGVRRVVLIDPDRVDCARNGRSCSIYADSKLAGLHKVDALAEVLSLRFPEVRVTAIPRPIDFVGLAALRDAPPLIWVSAVDSRRARYDVARAAIALGQPLVDLAIAGDSDQLVARARTTWRAVEGTHPLGVWSPADWRLLEERQPCGGLGSGSDRDERPITSAISGSLAAALALAQIRKLLAGDTGDVGWETRIDLGHASLVRCRLPKTDAESSPIDLGTIGDGEATVVVCASTLAELVSEAEAALGRGAEIVLNRQISPGFVCSRCQRQEDTPAPITARECGRCGEPQHAVLPMAGLTRDSLGSLAGAPLDCLGTEDDLLLARSADESRQLWLEYRLERHAEVCPS